MAQRTNGRRIARKMKTMKKWQVVEMTRVERRAPAQRRAADLTSSSRVTLDPQPSTLSPLRAFTLIELLVVIAIMGVLAALIFPVVGAVKRHQYIYNAQAEMAQLETAIDRYKAAYGFYPPSPTNPPTAATVDSTSSTMNWWERLLQFDQYTTVYTTLDGSAQHQRQRCARRISGRGRLHELHKSRCGRRYASVARNFLPELKPNQIGDTIPTQSALWV